VLSFPPFRLDEAEEQLWKGPKLLAVRRKPFAILRYLVAHPRRLVTHDELLKEVWAGSVVSESSVRTHLHELRQVLGEGFIETVIGRGYRFISDVSQEGDAPAAPAPLVVTDRIVVGREDELRTLTTALDRARAGHRQIVFVTGEPGIGKTTLVDTFLDSLAGGDVFAVRGACVEQLSAPEAYRPVIEMLAQLRHSKHADAAIGLLVRYAPTFLSQVPQLVPDAQLEDIMRRAAGGTEARVARELMELFEAISMHTTHLLVFEDMQWSDVATIDLLALIGQRRDRAKLLVIATSRRAEAQTVSHPLNRVMRALVARSGAVSLPLERLEDVNEYVDARFPGHAFPPAFGATLENITAGTPLFLAAVLDDLVARGMIAQQDGTWTLAVPVGEIAAHRPDSLKQLIDIQLDRLSTHEQRVLEAASLVGPVFQTALVAAALETPIESADELCDGLARRALFLQHEGTEDWPDGSQQSCYGFTHGLVRDVCAERSAPARRQRWHRAIAEALERAYAGHTHEVSAVLAMHYEQAQVVARALQFYSVAGVRMVNRFASGDALPMFRRALRLLERLPETTERDTTELRIRGGMVSAVLRSPFSNDESIAHCERMIALARKLGDTTALCSSLVNLSVRYATLARHQEANAINVELVGLMTSMEDPTFVAAVQSARALPAFWQGRLGEAMEMLEVLTRPETKLEDDRQLGILDPVARKAVLTAYLGAASWTAGQPDRSLQEFERAIQMSAERGDPFVFGLARLNCANVHIFRGDPPSLVREAAEAVLANQDAATWHPQATMLLYWVRSTEEPLPRADVDFILQRFRERHAELPLGTAYSAIKVVDAVARSGFHAEAIAFADEMLAFARTRQELMYEPELVRMRARLTTDRIAAAAALRTALADAERMAAHSIALRIAIDLMREQLIDRDVLAAALARIVGGETTADVRAAKQLLG
jgi:DNA-binding winged helix-turn-helix (wHTH) protein